MNQCAVDISHMMPQLFDHASESIVIVDTEGRILYANRATVVYGGKSLDDLLGNLFWDVYPDLADLYRIEFERVVQEQIPLSIEFYFPPAEKWFEVRFYPSSEAVAIFSTDITERKNSEEAQSLIAAIVESSDDAIISKDLQSTIHSWNRGAERLFGYTAQEAIGQPITLLMPPDRFDEEPGILSRIRSGERINDYETVRRRKDGTLFDISLTVSPVLDKQGQVIGASKIARDITERKQAEEALRKSEEKYRLLFENVDQGFCILEMIWDTEGLPVDYRFLEFNPVFEEMTGLVNATGRTAREMIPDLEAFWFERYGEVARTRESVRFQHGSIAMGRVFDVFASSLDGDRVVILFTDITDNVRREQVNEALMVRLQRSMAETHHRVKNNLQVIASLVEMQAADIEDQALATPLHRINQHVQALSVIHDLLTQQVKNDANIEHIGTQAVLEQLIRLLQQTIGDRQIVSRVDDALLSAQKAASLALLVSECVSNAVKHSSGMIDITLELEDDKAKLEICDDGDGFPADFDPRKAANTGLTLIESTARWDLGGDVHYDNHGLGGGRVTVTFPVELVSTESTSVL